MNDEPSEPTVGGRKVRVDYDRVSWNLKPVFIAHDMLVQQQRHADAEVWRRALVERTKQRADVFLEHLNELQRVNAMTIPTSRLFKRQSEPGPLDDPWRHCPPSSV